MALAADDEELARAATNIAALRYELNPGVPSAAGAAAHTRGLLNHSRHDLEQAASILATGQRPLAAAAALEDLGCARLAGGDRGGAVEAFDRVLGSTSTWEPRRTRPEPASGCASSVSSAGCSRLTARNRSGTSSCRYPAALGCGRVSAVLLHFTMPVARPGWRYRRPGKTRVTTV